MTTEFCDIRGRADYDSVLARAAGILTAGGLVVIPTETVYGLAANALDDESMKRLRRLKERPADHPFTVHIGQPEDAHRYVEDIPPYAKRMMARGWPGPLTLILAAPGPARTKIARDHPNRPSASLYHENTIGLRCPDHRFARALLDRLDVPVVAASANRSGRPAPVEAGGIAEHFDQQVDLIVDDGRTRYAQPSTVADVTGKTFRIVRQGILDERMLRSHAALRILLVCTGNTCRSPMAEALCRDMLARKLDIAPELLREAGYHVYSAGVHGLDGAPASQGALQAVQQRGLDLSRHVARAVDVGMLRDADYIWVMCDTHLQGITAMVPSVRGRARLLADGEEIEDPIGQPQECYNECAEKLARGLRTRLEEVEL
ncbi:MAG: threonylcarbamoyl-AMP synthase [Phycisphaerales bacterium]|nr:MAG: threonylcarbamoyl-AMP synthase [Phycisphaerales bacterium]